MTPLLLAIGLALMMLVWADPHIAYAQTTQYRAVQRTLMSQSQSQSQPRLETLFKEFVRWHQTRQ